MSLLARACGERAALARGATKSRSVIAEQGACTVTCEFCQKPYKFDAIDVEHLFDHGYLEGSDAIN